MQPKYPASTKLLLLAVFGYSLYFLIANQLALWSLDENGFTKIQYPKLLPPYWDFTNLWSGSVIAMNGHVEWLFDIEQYRKTLDQMFDAKLDRLEWSYPPHILLLGIPLATLPIFFAYLIWTVGSLTALTFAISKFKVPIIYWAPLVFCPAIAVSLFLGQNGAFVAALFLLGLLLAPTRPILAGILIGCLTIKPHLGILIPFCLLAAGNIRTIVSATLTTVILLGSSVLLFGIESWLGFFNVTRPLMVSVLEAPFPQTYHVNAFTFFTAMRSVGLSINLAYIVQFIGIILAVVGAMYIWRPSFNIEHRLRVILTGLLTLIATPYGYTYDITIFYFGLIWYILTDKRANISLVALLWIIPIFNADIVRAELPAFGIFAIVVLFIVLIKPIIQKNASDATQ